MMIVDLIDEVDFKEKMLAVGAPVNDCQTVDDILSALDKWLGEVPENLPLVKAACSELLDSGATILPDVQSVLKILLQK